jgi:hypothetical protein
VSVMVDPIHEILARTELERLGASHFLDVRATARRMLERMAGLQRAGYAVAAAERLLREDERLPARERPPHVTTWRPVLDAIWRGLAGDRLATREVAAAMARFYVSPDFYDRRHDDPADGHDHTIMAACYAAECFLHGCLDFACWAGWRGFDAATLRAAADTGWPHRRPAGVSPYTWELAHPAIQSELEQQLLTLERLSIEGVPALAGAGRAAREHDGRR